MTVFNFPDTSGKPTDGTFTWTAPNGLLYSWDGDAWRTIGGGGDGNASITITDDLTTIPAPDAGDLAWHTIEARMYIYYQDDDSQQWVDASPAGDGGGEIYWDRTGTTLSPVTAGDDVDLGTGDLTADVIRSGGSPDNGADIGAYYGPGYSAICRNGAQNVYTVYQQGTIANTAAIFADGSAVFGNKAAGPNIALNADGSGTFSGNISTGNYPSGNGCQVTNYGLIQTVAPNGSSAIRFSNGNNPGVWTSSIDSSGNANFDGDVKIGGTLPASPNITLNANGKITLDHPTGDTTIELKRAGNRMLFVNATGSNFVQCQSGSGQAIRVVAGDGGTGVELGVQQNSWQAISDERAKTALTTIEGGLQKVGSIRAVTGRYKTDDENTSRSFLIAQDVEKVLPEAVDSSNSEELKLRYTEVIPLLVSALHDAKDRIEALEAKVQALKGGN